MPRGCSTGATKKSYQLENGVWMWKVLDTGEAFGRQQFTEDGFTRNGDEKIQLVLKVGNEKQNITIIETLTFNEASEWKLNEFLKSAGIYPGEGVDYFLTGKMCVGLRGQCRTVNKERNGYTNTNIAEFLEAGSQHPETLNGFLLSEKDMAINPDYPTPDTPVDNSDIPF